MPDIKMLQSQLEQVLAALMALAESRPDVELAEAADHLSAALTRLQAVAEEGAVAVEESRTPASSAEETRKKSAWSGG
jgi:hypothetical protein